MIIANNNYWIHSEIKEDVKLFVTMTWGISRNKKSTDDIKMLQTQVD